MYRFNNQKLKLTEKIIDLMIAYKDEHHNVIVKSSVESLIQKVKDLEE